MRKPYKGYASRHVACRQVGDGYVITMVGKSKPLVRIVQDAKYPGRMWRVVEEDGSLSDMVNLTRAVDAARVRAADILNR